MKQMNRFVSLNYFILPGFTDDPDEYESLCHLLEEFKPDLIQLRHLNLDPDCYLEGIGFKDAKEPLGIRLWLQLLSEKFPSLKFGYFNPYIKSS